MPTWLTADEIARKLGRPVSTIRSWRDRYRPFVPEQIDGERRQTYPLERLAEIQALQAQDLTTREVRAELARRHGRTDQEGEAAPDRLDQILDELRELRRSVEWLVARERERSG